MAFDVRVNVYVCVLGGCDVSVGDGITFIHVMYAPPYGIYIICLAMPSAIMCMLGCIMPFITIIHAMK